MNILCHFGIIRLKEPYTKNIYQYTTRLEMAPKVAGGMQKYHLHETSQTDNMILEFTIYYSSKTTLMTKYDIVIE